MPAEVEQEEPKRTKKIPHFKLPNVPKGCLNTPEEKILEQIAENIRRPLPQVSPHMVQDRVAIITCGGPSLKQYIWKIREMRDQGAAIFAMNGSGNFLMTHGITPSCIVMMDARPHMVRCVEDPIPGCRYLIGSQCHPDVFEKVKDRDTWIWHADVNINGEQKEKEVLDEYYNGRYVIIEGGSTVGLRSLMLARTLGFVKIEMFGFDGCHMSGEHHAYAQPENDHERTTDVSICGRKFRMSGWQVKQYEDFINLINWRGGLFDATIHGDGVFAHVCRYMTSPTTRAKLFVEKYLRKVIGVKFARKVCGLPYQEGDNGSASVEVLQHGEGVHR